MLNPFSKENITMLYRKNSVRFCSLSNRHHQIKSQVPKYFISKCLECQKSSYSFFFNEIPHFELCRKKETAMAQYEKGWAVCFRS